MKSVFIAGSRKFFEEIESLVKNLEGNCIKVSTAGKWNKDQKDTFESERNALLRAFREIDNSDVVYIFSKDGYIGKTVALEIAYSFANRKEIVSSCKIEDFSARSLISKVMKPEDFIEYAEN